MRSRFVALVLAVSLLLVGVVVWLRPAPVPVHIRAATPVRTAPEGQPEKSLQPGEASMTPVTAESAEEKPSRSLSVEAQADRLMEISRKKETGALVEIVQAFNSPDKEIRAASIEAAKQLGDVNAIPELKAAAEATNDLEEKIDFLEAIDFLNTPSLAFNDSSPARVSDAARERHRSNRRKLENN